MDTKEDAFERAYQEACKKGTTKSFRAKLNIVGHTDVGKTSLCHRLLGQSIPEDTKSTEGITTHLMNSKLHVEDLKTEDWTEVLNQPKDILAKFYSEVLMKHEEIGEGTKVSTDISEVKETLSNSSEINSTLKESGYKENIMDKETDIPKMSSKMRDELNQHYQTNYNNSSPTSADYSLQLWDYGGHTEFLATHHIFLNTDSTTLILLDISKDLNQPIDVNMKEANGIGIPYTPAQFLNYWLNTVHRQSVEKQCIPNVILVLTHIDMIQATNVKEYTNNYILELNRAVEQKPYEKYINEDNIFFIDNRNGPDEDFVSLQNEIFKMITKQKRWGMERPTRWLKLEADVFEKTNKEKLKYLELAVVQDLGKVYGIDADELTAFLDFHNKLGDLVHYAEPGLKDIVITDPQWLADMFKTLITAPEFINQRSLEPDVAEEVKQGIITFKTLETVWKGEHVQFLIHLFENFNLLLYIGSTVERERFIIPCMLPYRKKDVYEDEPFRSMVLTYNSEHITKSGNPLQIGIFHRLLSECSKKWPICAEDHLSYTDASFQVTDNVRLAITHQNEHTIRASIWCKRELIDPEMIQLVLESKNNMDLVFEVLHMKCPETFLLLCQHARPEDKDICLVKVRKVENPKTSGFILKSTEKCYVHHEELVNYEIPSTDKSITEMQKVQEVDSSSKKIVPSLESQALKLLGRRSAPAPNWGTCSMTMTQGGNRFIATKSCGEARILKGPKSDVSLHIPKGSTGVFRKCVHTDHSRFKCDIPEEECIITPLVEIHRREVPDVAEQIVRGNFVIRIPHCIPDKSLWKLVKVRKWTQSGTVSEELVQEDEMVGHGNYFMMEEKFITVTTQHFCKVAGTICDQEGCRRSLRVLLMGKLENRHTKNLSMVKLKSFLCSHLLRLRDFKKHLVGDQISHGLTCVEEGDINIKPKSFDPQTTLVTMTFKTSDTETASWVPSKSDDKLWIPTEGLFRKKKTLEDILEYVPCPCRSVNIDAPMAAMEVNMKTEGFRDDFDGVFDVAVKMSNDNENAEVSRIQFTLLPFPGRFRSSSVSFGETLVLTDLMLHEVSLRITNEIHVRKLGLRLQVSEHDIQAKLHDNAITIAAYHVLKVWFDNQQDKAAAYQDLVQALEDVKLKSIISDVLNY